jgi:thiamine-phosphate pyrophosphorylase
MGRPRIDLSLYFVTDAEGPRDVVATVEAALRGGATVIQLRDKGATDEILIGLAARLAPATRAAGAALILNDRVEAAARADVDGVHVGQGDLDAAAARARLGAEAILGLSATNREEAAALDPTLVDYCGLGPVFATATKPDATPPLGLLGFGDACRACPVPVVAIGGLGVDNGASVLAAGAAGLAVVTAISRAADPEGAARALRALGD